MQTGIPPGISWSVTFDGVFESGTGNLSFLGISNGTYQFNVGSIPGFTASPRGGWVTVDGTSANEVVTFAGVQPTLLGLPQTEGWAAIGGILGLATVFTAGAVGLLRRRSRPRKPDVRP